jgi:hypothetical protein
MDDAMRKFQATTPPSEGVQSSVSGQALGVLQTQAGQVNRPPPVVKMLADQFSAVADTLEAQARRIGVALDRLEGPQPSQSGGSKADGTETPSHHLARLRDALERLHKVAQALNASNERIDKLV